MRPPLRYSTILVLILTLAGSAFAHRAPSPELTPMLSAYLSVGGSLEDLCGGSYDPRRHGGADCEACRLVGAATLPLPPSVPVLVFGSHRVEHPQLAIQPGAFSVRDPGLGARAPPTA